jgi:hypothetical protein
VYTIGGSRVHVLMLPVRVYVHTHQGAVARASSSMFIGLCDNIFDVATMHTGQVIIPAGPTDN